MHSRLPLTFAGMLASVASFAQLAITPVVTGFATPNAIAQPPGETNRIFVVEQRFAGANSTGRISFTKRTAGVWGPRQSFLSVPNLATGGEQGLLGLAFHPDYAVNRKFYVNCTPTGGATEIREYQANAMNPDLADTPYTVLLTIPQPYANHNGGTLLFGPDGYLYIGMGDGGLGGDPENRALNINELLGKMLRIDVNGDDFPNDPSKNYRIPADNPYVGVPGLDEIWAIGLRNPWKFAFDKNLHNGFDSLTIADVGEGAREEVNHVPPGAKNVNYGWRVREGSLISNRTGYPNLPNPTDPIFEYTHNVGRSVSGGEVYRGWELGPDFWNDYVFADFSQKWLFSFDLTQNVNTGAATATGGSGPFSTLNFLATTLFIPCVTADNTGELWMLGYSGSLNRITRVFPSGVSARNIQGTLNFSNLAPSAIPRGVRLNLDIAGTGSPTSDFVFPLATKPDGTFRVPTTNTQGRLWIKYGTFLRQVKPFDAASGNVSGIQFDLINGDIDGDGEVGPSDFEQVVSEFGNPGPNIADLDADGEVGPSDFETVVQNFGLADDPL